MHSHRSLLPQSLHCKYTDLANNIHLNYKYSLLHTLFKQFRNQSYYLNDIRASYQGHNNLQESVWSTSPVTSDFTHSTGISVVDVIYLSATLPENRIKVFRILQPRLHAKKSISLIPFTYVKEGRIVIANQPVVPSCVVLNTIR